MTINRPACSFRIVIISVMFDRATQFADDERRHRANDGISSERLSSIRARGKKKTYEKCPKIVSIITGQTNIMLVIVLRVHVSAAAAAHRTGVMNFPCHDVIGSKIDCVFVCVVVRAPPKQTANTVVFFIYFPPSRDSRRVPQKKLLVSQEMRTYFIYFFFLCSISETFTRYQYCTAREFSARPRYVHLKRIFSRFPTVFLYEKLIPKLKVVYRFVFNPQQRGGTGYCNVGTTCAQ